MWIFVSLQMEPSGGDLMLVIGEAGLASCATNTR